MSLIYIKTKQGEDLVAEKIDDDIEFLTISNAISLKFDIDRGLYAVNWLIMSSESSAKVRKSDLYFYHSASEKATAYHAEFKKNSHTPEGLTSEDEELASVFEIMLESQRNTKH